MVPDARTLAGYKPEHYAKLIRKMKRSLKQATGIACTCDAWTNDSNKAFLAISAHYYDKKLRRRSMCLAVLPLVGKHSSECMCPTWPGVGVVLELPWYQCCKLVRAVRCTGGWLLAAPATCSDACPA